LVRSFYLLIYLRVEYRRKLIFRFKLYDKGLPKVAGKKLIAIGDNFPKYAVVSDNIPNKGINKLISISVFNER
jgi:hypothetical protein